MQRASLACFYLSNDMLTYCGVTDVKVLLLFYTFKENRLSDVTYLCLAPSFLFPQICSKSH